MAIRVDRPAGAGDEVVVFVARSLEEARAARDALVAAGIVCELPDAGLEAVFAQPGASVQVRVTSRDFSRAMDVIDARFPPPEPVDLPPPVEPVKTIRLTDDHAAARDEADDDEADELDVRALDEAAARAQGARLAKTALKVGGIAVGGLLVPGFGVVFSVLAVVAATWCLKRSACFPDSVASIRVRAGVALLLALGGLVSNALFVLSWWSGPVR